MENGYLMDVEDDAGGEVNQRSDAEWVDIEDEEFVHDLERFSRNKCVYLFLFLNHSVTLYQIQRPYIFVSQNLASS